MPWDQSVDWTLIDFTDPPRDRPVKVATPAPDGPPAQPGPAPKGACPKCRKHIGRGVGLHAKRCEGGA